jgi:hypothetical protein
MEVTMNEDKNSIVEEMDDEAKMDKFYNTLLWNRLKEHRGHHVSIVSYGDWDDPSNIALECEECGCVILDAELYTLCAREDV